MNRHSYKMRKKLTGRSGSASLIEFAGLVVPTIAILVLVATEVLALAFAQGDTIHLGRTLSIGAQRNCGALGAGADLNACLDNELNSAATAGAAVLAGFTSRGTLRLTSYAIDPLTNNAVILSQRNVGGGGFASRLNTGNIDMNVLANFRRLLVAEVEYTWAPVTGVPGWIGFGAFPGSIYNVFVS